MLDPLFTVIAGPNGSGKSTVVRSLSFDSKDKLLNPDDVAKTLSPSDPQKAAISAGRFVLTQTDQYIVQRVSFAVETTLSSKHMVKTLALAKQNGFETSLVYISLAEPEHNIERVQIRVAEGGHDVPDEDVRRRYTRSLSIATEVIKLVDHAIVFDNSGPQHRKILAAKAGVLTYTAEDLPTWASPLRAALLA